MHVCYLNAVKPPIIATICTVKLLHYKDVAVKGDRKQKVKQICAKDVSVLRALPKS